MFREFLYLNPMLVNQFLAQAESGLFDESIETSNESGKGGVGGGLKAGPIDARADKSKGRSFQDERRVRQTPESQFNRLYDHLQQDGLLVLEEIDDPDYASGLPRGSVLEIHDVVLSRSGFQEIGGMAKQIADLVPLMDAFGVDTGIDPTQLKQATAFDDESKPLGVIGAVPGTAKLKLGLELDRSALLGDVAGEATVLVKVSKVLKRGQTHMVGDPTGGLSQMMSRQDRRKMLKGFDKTGATGPTLTKPEIRYPGLVATVVAIYR